MRKFFKAASFLMSVVLLISVFTVVPYAADKIISGDFVFTENAGTLTLTEYKGSGGVVDVPVTVGGKKVTAIGNQAFAEYYNSTPDEKRITKVSLPTTVTSIGKNAFLECTKLSVVEMTGVKSLGEAAFWYCKGLKKVAVSAELKAIGKNAFGKCDNVTIYCEKGSVAEEYAKSNSIKKSALYPEKISFSKSTYYVDKGKKATLKVSVTPSDAYYKDLYFSASGKNATVSSSGKVTAKNLGTERIGCIAVFGGATAECIVSVRTPGVKNLAAKSSALDSVTLSWQKASGAQGYRVEIMQGGKWKKLADTKSLSFTQNGLESGKAYNFSVRAYTKVNKTTYFSTRSEVNASVLSLGRVKSINPDSYTAKGLSFSWANVKNASGYQVYALSSDGKWTKVKETRDLIFSEKLKESTLRTYKVRAFAVVNGKRVYGKYTSAFTFSSKPGKVSNLSVSGKTKNSITLKWNGVKNASEYAVYSVSGGKYTLVKKTASKSLTISNLKSETKYTYAVRAVINTSLKTTYGDYSLSVSAVTSPLISAQQSAVNDITAAVNKVTASKSFYSVCEEKTTVSLSSSNASSKNQKILNAYADLFSESSKTAYNFEGGKAQNGVTPKDVFIPEGGFSIRAADIKSVTRVKDGSGTVLTITFKGESVSGSATPAINSGIWGGIDKNKLDEASREDGKIDSLKVNYQGTVISAKLNTNGTFDTFTVSVPFEATVVCTIGKETSTNVFSGRIIREYTLSWW